MSGHRVQPTSGSGLWREPCSLARELWAVSVAQACHAFLSTVQRAGLWVLAWDIAGPWSHVDVVTWSTQSVILVSCSSVMVVEELPRDV